MKAIIEVKENVNEFKNGDILVFDSKTKTFITANINDFLKEKLNDLQKETLALKEELVVSKKRYHILIDRLNTLVDELWNRLSFNGDKEKIESEEQIDD